MYALAVAATQMTGAHIDAVHVSTMGFVPHDHPHDTHIELNTTQLTQQSGYAQSKYVAEKALIELSHMHTHKLSHRNTPGHTETHTPNVFIFRPGVVSGHTGTGAANARDGVMMLIRGLIEEHTVCTCVGSPLPHSVNMCPVDCVAETISEITLCRHARPWLTPARVCTNESSQQRGWDPTHQWRNA